MNQGKTVFAQLMSMIPEYEFDKCVDHITEPFKGGWLAAISKGLLAYHDFFVFYDT